jgi:hypothetical protein
MPARAWTFPPGPIGDTWAAYRILGVLTRGHSRSEYRLSGKPPQRESGPRGDMSSRSEISDEAGKGSMLRNLARASAIVFVIVLAGAGPTLAAEQSATVDASGFIRRLSSDDLARWRGLSVRQQHEVLALLADPRVERGFATEAEAKNVPVPLRLSSLVALAGLPFPPCCLRPQPLMKFILGTPAYGQSWESPTPGPGWTTTT